MLTTTGGAAWTDITGGFDAAALAALNSASSFSFHAIAMVSTSIAYVSATAGVVLRTVDGGTTWTVDYQAPPLATVLCVAMSRFGNGQTGVAGFQRSTVPSQAGMVAVRSPDPTTAPTYTPTMQPARPTSQPTRYKQPSTRPTAHPTGSIDPAARSPSGYVWNTVFTGQAGNIFQAAAYARTSPEYVVAVGAQFSNGLILYSNAAGAAGTWTTLLVPQLVPVRFQDVDSVTDAFQNVYFLAVSNVGIIYYADNAGAAATWNWQAVATLTLASTGGWLGACMGGRVGGEEGGWLVGWVAVRALARLEGGAGCVIQAHVYTAHCVHAPQVPR